MNMFKTMVGAKMRSSWMIRSDARQGSPLQSPASFFFLVLTLLHNHPALREPLLIGESLRRLLSQVVEAWPATVNSP